MPFGGQYMQRVGKRRTFKRRRTGGYRKLSFRRSLRRLARNFSTFKSASIQWQSPSSIIGGTSGVMVSVHNSTASSSSNGYVHLSGIPVGTGPATRTGNRVQLLRLTVRGLTYTSVEAPTPSTNMGRIVFYMVMNNANDTLGVGSNDIVNAMLNWTSATYAGVLAPWNPQQVPSAIRIIKDIYINPWNVCRPASGAGASNTGAVTPWQFSVNLRKYMGRSKFSTYSGASNTANDSVSNQLFCAFIQSTPTPADIGSLVSIWSFKLSYIP